jgi:hypothetical protein
VRSGRIPPTTPRQEPRQSQRPKGHALGTQHSAAQHSKDYNDLCCAAVVARKQDSSSTTSLYNGCLQSVVANAKYNTAGTTESTLLGAQTNVQLYNNAVHSTITQPEGMSSCAAPHSKRDSYKGECSIRTLSPNHTRLWCVLVGQHSPPCNPRCHGSHPQHSKQLSGRPLHKTLKTGES